MKIFTLPLLRGLYLPEQRDFLNPLELHGEAAKPMQQIYKSIIRLAVMGDDERRSIWLRFQSDYNGVQWGYMHITTYREYHYLYIGAKYTRFASCKWRVDSEENVDESANDFFGYTKAYQKFADKVLPIIDSIYANPEAYNAYINRYVPYALREGKIHRFILNQIVPEFKLGLKNAVKTIEALQRSIAEDYPTFDTMTIRMFCQYFRAADEQFHHIPYDSGQTDVEYYQKLKWHNLDEFDLDSKADFKKFAVDHYGELGLSRCNVHAYKRDDDKWEISIGLGYYHNLVRVLEMITACYEMGLPMKIWNADKLLEIIEERDYVGFAISTFHQRLGNGEIGNDIELDDDLLIIEDSKRRRAAQRAIIQAAEWSPLEQVHRVNS